MVYTGKRVTEPMYRVHCLHVKHASGTHTSQSYTQVGSISYCVHTRVWPTGTVTTDTVLIQQANPFAALHGGIALACVASTPCSGSILINLPLENFLSSKAAPYKSGIVYVASLAWPSSWHSSIRNYIHFEVLKISKE